LEAPEYVEVPGLVAPIDALKADPEEFHKATVAELEEAAGTVNEVVLDNTLLKLTASKTVFSLTRAEFKDLASITGN
jgi:hypothetical protein